jgi:branched-chain amino acid transport system permease protein
VSVAYFSHVLIWVCIYGVLAQSLNVSYGLGRVFNLAHISSFALGAYTTALLSIYREFPPLNETMLLLDNSFAGEEIFFVLCLFSSASVAALLALFIGGMSQKLSSDAFAMGTLAFSSLIGSVLMNWQSVTNGVLGLSGISRPEVLRTDWQANERFVFIALAIFLFAQLLLYLLFRSPMSRRLRAQADFPFAAEGLGIPVFSTRQVSFLLAAAGAGVSGALYAFFLQFVDPTSFSMGEMIFVLTIVTVGGPGMFWGTLLATFFMFLIPELIASVPWINTQQEILGPLRQFVFAFLLYGVILLNRDRLFPSLREV